MKEEVGEDVSTEGWGGVLQCAVFWTGQGHGTHELPTATVTCTSSSQQDQLTF